MIKTFAMTVLLASTLFVAAEPQALHADQSATAESEIKALQVKLGELIVHGDWDEYSKYLAPDYLHTRENGHVETKDEAMAALRDVQRKIIFVELQPADATVRIYGDTAISNAEFIFTVRDSGQVKTRHSRITDVFVKHDGQWYLVSQQGTALGK